MRVDGDEHNATTSKVSEPEDASTQMSPQQRASHTDGWTHTHTLDTRHTHTTHTRTCTHTYTLDTHTHR